MAKQRKLGRCSMSDLEIGFGARNANEWDALQHNLGIFPVVSVVSADFDKALEVQRALAALGLKGRKVPDLLIAAAAARLELTILHYDRDFELISEVTGQPTSWIVEAGSID